MPNVVVDAILVEGGWDPSALERGLAASERLVQEFVARTSAGARITPTIAVDLASTAAFARQLSTIVSPTIPVTLDVSDAEAAVASVQAHVRAVATALETPTPVTIDIQPALHDAEALDARVGAVRRAISDPIPIVITTDEATGQARRLAVAQTQLIEQTRAIAAAQVAASARVEQMSAAEAQQTLAAVRAAGALQLQADAAQRAADQLAQAQRLTVAGTPPPVVPAVVVPPPDFSGVIQASARALANVRDTIIRSLSVGAAAIEDAGIAAGLAAIRGLETGINQDIRTLGQQVATGLLDPAEATRQADAMVAAAVQEIRARAPELAAALRGSNARAAGSGPNLSGLTTARSGGLVSTAELEEADRAFAELTGAADATQQSFLRVGSSSSTMRLGVRQAASTLTVLASQSLQTNSAIGRLAESLLLLGGGLGSGDDKIVSSLGKIAVAAGVVLVVAKAYEFLSTAEREAQKEQDDLVAGLLQEAASMTAAERAARGLAAALAAQADARAKTLRNQALGALASGVTLSPAFGQAVGLELARRQQNELRDATKAATQAQRDQEKATQDFQDLNVATLTQAIALHGANNFQLRQARGFLAVLAQQEEAVGTTVARKLELQRQVNSLQDALNAGVRQEIALRQVQASIEQAHLTALAAAPGLGTDTAASIRERAAEMARLNAIIQSGTASLTERNDAAAQFTALVQGQLAPMQRALDLQHRATTEALAAFQATHNVADLQGASGVTDDLDAQIARYRELERQAGRSAITVQALADKRHALELERQAADDVLKSFANIGGLAKDVPVLQFKATFAFVSPIEAIVDAVTGRADARIRANLDKILAALKQRSDAAFSAGLGNVSLPENTIPAGFDRAQDSVKGLSHQLTDAAMASNKFFAKAKRDAEDLRKPMERLNDSLHDITRGLDSIVGAAHNIGRIGDEAADSINDVLNLADAVGDLAKNASTGNILAAVGAGIGVLGSAFGPSEAERERNRILAENNDLLRRNTAALANQQGGIGGLGALGITAAQLAAIHNVEAAGRVGPKGNEPQATKDLRAILAEAGTNVRDFAAQIKAATGIDILDSKGRIVAGAFDQAADAIAQMVAAASRFADTFADQVSFADLQARISGGLGDAVDQFQRDLGAAGSADSDFIATFFDGIDIRGDADAFQQRLQDLLALFAPDSTFFTEHPELLGGLSPDDWRKILTDGADAMDLLRDATRGAAQQLGDLNLPQGFRRAALAFETGDTGPGIDLAARQRAVDALFPATRPTSVAPVVQPLPDDVQSLLDRIATTAPPDLLDAVTRIGDLIERSRPVAPDLSATGRPTAPIFADAAPPRPVTITFGDIVVNIPNGNQKDARQIAEETVREFRRIAMAQSGDTLQVGLF